MQSSKESVTELENGHAVLENRHEVLQKLVVEIFHSFPVNFVLLEDSDILPESDTTKPFANLLDGP